MSNKVYSPVVVENPIIPAIASSSVLYNCQSQENGASCKTSCYASEKNSCRSETKYVLSTNSSKNCAQSVNPNTYHSFKGRELVLQFENLQCTENDSNNIEKVKKTSKYSSALTLKAVKHRPFKKAVISKGIRSKKEKTNVCNSAKFVLKPSKLNRCVKAALNRSYTDSHTNPLNDSLEELKADKELSLYHDFSIACSKELETIEQASASSNESSLRPRSSSLPAAGASASHPNSSASPSPEKNGSPTATQNSTTRRSRRKHLSKCDTRVSNNDLNVDSPSNDQKVTSRGSKRRISPPEHSISSVQKSAENLEDERNKPRDNLDASIDRLADYLEDSILLPKKMSFMAEMMYT